MPKGPVFLPREHGTLRGYQQHMKRDMPACTECRIANSEAQRERRIAERKKKGLATRKQGSGSAGTGVDFANIDDLSPETQRAAGLVMAGIALRNHRSWDVSGVAVRDNLSKVLIVLGIKEDREQDSGSS